MSAIMDEFEAGKMVNIRKVETCIATIAEKFKLLGKNVDYNRRDNITMNICLTDAVGQNIVLLCNYFTRGRRIDIPTALLIVQHMLDSWILLKPK
jgi:hypothetical protein